MSMMRLHVLAALALVVAGAIAPHAASAAEPVLVIDRDGTQRQLTAASLLKRPDTVPVTVQDKVFGRPLTYRAVPVLALLGDIAGARFDTLEVRASDGFVTQIPLALIASGATGGAVAWMAVEDPAQPWPTLPNRTVSPGPFYLVWEHPERSGVISEQWVYELAALTFVESPVHRWPQLAVPASLPPDAPARRGQAIFLTQCLPCHRMKGGGAGEMGPDLGQPMNPTQYLSKSGLRALIRSPRAVRSWPDQHMVGFDKAALPDVDLDAVVAYLHAMAGEAGTATPK
jgi:mono/diheme cytochrome c family protein